MKKGFFLFLGGIIIAFLSIVFRKKKTEKKIDGSPVEDKLNELQQEIVKHSEACKKAGDLLDEFNQQLLKEIEERNNNNKELTEKIILET